MSSINTKPRAGIFKRILVPIVYGCDQSSAVNAARAIAGIESVMFIGLVYIPSGSSLSSAAIPVQEVRQMLRTLSSAVPGHRWTEVYATHHPWDEIVSIAGRVKPDLLILEHPCHFEILKTTPTDVLTHPPCDIAIVNSKISENPGNGLIPIRGGPYSELALRTALSIQHFHPVEMTALHLLSLQITLEQDAAFRGIENVLKSLPEVKKQQIVTDAPGKFIFDVSHQYDFLVMGASARSSDDVTSIGPVAEKS